jgi:hypothetical protein
LKIKAVVSPAEVERGYVEIRFNLVLITYTTMDRVAQATGLALTWTLIFFNYWRYNTVSAGK